MAFIDAYIKRLYERAQAKRDGMTDADVTIDYAHHEIHEGNSYRADLSVSTAATFDTTDAMIMTFKTPATGRWLHAIFFAKASDSCTLEILEGATVTATTPIGNGAITILNRERNGSKTSAVADTYSGVAGQVTGGETAVGNGPPTIAADGTTLYTEQIGGGSPKTGGESRDIAEWVLKADTVYAIRLTSNAENVLARVAMIWYEHTNKFYTKGHT